MFQEGQEERPALLTYAENPNLSKEIEPSSISFFHSSFYSFKQTFSSINMTIEKQTNEVLAKLDKYTYVCLILGFFAMIAFLVSNVYLGYNASYDEHSRVLPTMAGLAFGISIGLQIAKTYFKSLIAN
jgi:hypothetical protein